jgi:hypothetical protein
MDALAVVGDEIVGVGTAGDWTIEDHRGSYGWLRGYTIDGAPSRSFELHPDGSTRDSVSFTAVGAVGGLPGVLAARAVSSGGGRYAIVPTLEVYAPSGTTYQRIATMSAPTGLQLDGRLAGAPGLPWVTAINTDTTPGGTATAQYDVRSWSPAGARLGQLAGPSSASSVEALDANGSSYWLATSEMGGVISRLGITTTGTITSSARVTVNDTVSGGQILSLHHTATGSAAAVIACGFSGTTDGWVMLIDAAASVVWSKQLPGTVIDDCASNAEGRVFVLRRDGLSEVAR